MTPYSASVHKDRKKGESNFYQLNNVKGNDTLEIFYDVMSNRAAYELEILFEKEKKTYKFSNIKYNKKERNLSAFISVGKYGVEQQIIETSDGTIAHTKTTSQASVLNHYIQFNFPAGVETGVVLLHKSHGRGIKSVIDRVFKPVFKEITGATINFNPLSHEKALQDWITDATVKAIKVKGYSPPSDITDELFVGFELNKVYTLTPKRHKDVEASLGLLSTMIGKDKSPLADSMVEQFKPFGGTVSAIAVLNGKSRSFDISNDGRNVTCDIPFGGEEDEDDVTIRKGQPIFKSIDKWSKVLANDVFSSIFTGKL